MSHLLHSLRRQKIAVASLVGTIARGHPRPGPADPGPPARSGHLQPEHDRGHHGPAGVGCGGALGYGLRRVVGVGHGVQHGSARGERLSAFSRRTS